MIILCHFLGLICMSIKSGEIRKENKFVFSKTDEWYLIIKKFRFICGSGTKTISIHPGQIWIGYASDPRLLRLSK